MRDDNDSRPRIGDLLRERGVGDTEDIGDLWDDQKLKETQINKLKADYEANKKKSKELRKELAKEYLDPTEIEGKLIDYATRAKSIVDNALVHIRNSKRKYALGVVGVLIVLFIGSIGSDKSNETSILGESTVISDDSTPELPIEKPKFELLFPSGLDEDQYQVARVSPDGSDPAYTYLDRMDGSENIFRVTQQKVPNEFSLAETAEVFQASNIIEVDGERIYHGYSEKGGTQSLFFIKESLLVSIRSPEKFSDEKWASYYLSLK